MTDDGPDWQARALAAERQCDELRDALQSLLRALQDLHLPYSYMRSVRLRVGRLLVRQSEGTP